VNRQFQKNKENISVCR